MVTISVRALILLCAKIGVASALFSRVLFFCRCSSEDYGFLEFKKPAVVRYENNVLLKNEFNDEVRIKDVFF